MAAQLPDQIFVYICTVPPTADGSYPFPTGCELRGPYDSGFLQEGSGTKEQYDALFGAVMMIVCMIIAIALIKKAIEQ